jgi:hypothetical protein
MLRADRKKIIDAILGPILEDICDERKQQAEMPI